MNRKKFLHISALLGFYPCIRPKALKAISSGFEKKSEFIENIIIGSGYGGAVVARRLAEAGHACTILEMGIDTRQKDQPFPNLLKPNKYAGWLRKRSIAPFGNVFSIPKFTGVLDRLNIDPFSVYIGRGLGGGSIVNGGMAVRPKKEYFDEVFPELSQKGFFETYFPRAEKELEVNHIQKDFYRNSSYYKYSRTGEKDAHKAGFKTTFIPNVYDFDYMQKEEKGEVPKSALGGEVIYGNNYGKKSLDKTYLKKALDSNLVDIKCMHKVHSIQYKDSGYILNIHVLNTQGEITGIQSIRCKRLFCCAGSMGTTRLLLTSASLGKLKGLPDSIGSGWGTNGNCMSGRNFVGPKTGIKQSTIPVVSIDDWENKNNPVFAEIAPLPMNLETWTNLYLVITKPSGSGQLVYNSNKDQLQAFFPNTVRKQIRESARSFIKRLNHFNKTTRSHLLFKNGLGEDICYHPLGGCVLNKACDHYGRVRNLKNLYVMDGSLIPGSIGVNPFLTITAITEYCIEEIIRKDF